MATTQNTFNGNGSNLGPFSFTFKWLESTDIKVSVGGVLKTAGTHYNLQALNYTTKTGGQVLFTAGNAPPAGTNNIRIYRDTDDEALSATFSSGSAIRAKDLNDNFTQNLYVTQEINNNALNVDGSNPMVGPLNMNGFQIDNLATPTSDTDAVNRAYVNDIVANGIGDGDKGDIVVSGSGSTLTIDSGAITNSKVNSTAGIVSSKLAFTQSGTGTVQRTVESKLQDVVSVLDFIPQSEHAAIKAGTSTYNATAAIQAAINAASGKRLYFPAGTYKINSKLTVVGSTDDSPTDNALNIYGDSQTSTTLDFTGVAGVAVEGYGWNVTIKDLRIIGASEAISLRRDNASNRSVGRWTLQNLQVNGCSVGIRLKGAYFVAIESCRVSQTTSYGIILESNIGTGDRSNANYIVNTQVYNNNSIAKVGTVGFYVANSISNTFVNCDCSGFEKGIQLDGISRGNNFISHYEERNTKPVEFGRGTSVNKILFGSLNTGTLRQNLSLWGGDNSVEYGSFKFDTNNYRRNLLINGGLEGQNYEDVTYGPYLWGMTGGVNSFIRTGPGASDTVSYRGRHPFARESQAAYKNPGTTNGIGLFYPDDGTEGPSAISVGNRKDYVAVAFIKLVSGQGPRLKLKTTGGSTIKQSAKAPTSGAYDGWFPLTLATQDELVDITSVRLFVENDSGETGVWYVDDIYFLPAEGHLHVSWSDVITLSAAGSESFLHCTGSEYVWHDVMYLYEEGTSADAGIGLTIKQRYTDGGQATIAAYTTEVSKPIGYQYLQPKTSFSSFNGMGNPDETFTVTSAGGKTGAGKVRVGFRYITF